VPLETKNNSIISEITKLLITKDKIIVFENYNLKRSIFLFNREGKYIGKIEDPGEGPGNFIAASDLLVNNDRNRLEILDKYQAKVVFYDFKGEFQGDVSVPYNFEEFVKMQDNIHVFSAGNAILNENEGDDLFWMNSFESIVNSALPVKEEVKNMTFEQYAFSTSRFDKSYLYRRIFDNKIYKVNNNEVKEYFSLSFGDDWISEDLIRRFEMGNPNEKLMLLNKFEKIYNIKAAEEFDTYLMFSYFFKQKLYLSFVDKTTLSARTYFQEYQSNRSNQTDGGVLPYFPRVKFDNYLIFTHPAHELLVHADEHRTQIRGNFKNLIRDLKPEDNPVIIFAKLKDSETMAKLLR
jgi:hypothetical protein